jgi:periplasmic divalent cation tolerance protein
MTPKHEHVLALSTAPSPEKAAELARTLVEERLAACVNLVPQVRSVYRWKDQLCDDAEVLIVIKTRRDRMAALEARLLALHPYEVPELVIVPIAAGSAAYLRWIDESVG